MAKKLDGKVAVVTGASKGIGAAIAQELAKEGARVVVNYSSSKAGADRVVNAIASAGGQAIAVQGDVSKEADIKKLFAETKKSFGRVDVLVNNAGVYGFAPLAEITAAEFHRQFDLNVLGLLLTSKEAVSHFGDAGGSIINIGSVVATLAPPGASVYSATKGAVNTITRALAKELGAKRIRVNAVNPGMVETEGTTSAGITESDMRKEVDKTTPLGRIGQPNDIAPVVAFLASDESKWVTGEMLYVSGGYR